jgi:hypothetical protein
VKKSRAGTFDNTPQKPVFVKNTNTKIMPVKASGLTLAPLTIFYKKSSTAIPPSSQATTSEPPMVVAKQQSQKQLIVQRVLRDVIKLTYPQLQAELATGMRRWMNRLKPRTINNSHSKTDDAIESRAALSGAWSGYKIWHPMDPQAVQNLRDVTIDAKRIRRFVARYTERFQSSLNFAAEAVTLKAFRDLLPKATSDSHRLTDVQLHKIVDILQDREKRVRSTSLRLTTATFAPENIPFIHLATQIGKKLHLPLIKVLMKVDNDACFNLRADFAHHVGSPLWDCGSIYFRTERDGSLTKRGLPFLQAGLYEHYPDTESILSEENVHQDAYLPPELYTLYVHENKLYSIKGLLVVNGYVDGRYTSTSYPFSTYTSPERTTRRPLTVNEFKQIKEMPVQIKNAYTVNLNVGNQKYTHPWALINACEISSWSRASSFAHEAMFELIQSYLRTVSPSDNRSWAVPFKSWCDTLCHVVPANRTRDAWIADVNGLYGTIIDPTNGYTFLDALISLSSDQSEENLTNKIALIAKRFCLIEPQSQGGDRLIAYLKLHFENIKDTPDDYFRVRPFASRHEKLARALSEQGSFCKNWVRSLVQTLKQDVDAVTLESLADIYLYDAARPKAYYLDKLVLHDFILSEDETMLLNLKASEANAEAGKGYCVVNTEKKRFFTEKEKSRIASNSKHAHHLSKIRTFEKSQVSLKFSTIQKIWKFVDQCLYLECGDTDILNHAGAFVEPHPNQLLKHRFIRDFDQFYNQLKIDDPDERNRLDAQLICREAYVISFADEYNEVALAMKDENNGVCMAEYFKRWLPLLIDHDPVTLFRPRIEEIPDITKPLPYPSLLSTLREGSQKRVYRDFGAMTQEEALRRIQILAVSVMSTAFEHKKMPLAIAGITLNRSGPSVCAEILRHITPLLQGGSTRQSRFVYAYLMLKVIKPAHLEPERRRSGLGLLFQNNLLSTHEWLTSIVSHRLFDQLVVWVSPACLLPKLNQILRVDHDLKNSTEFREVISDLTDIQSKKLSGRSELMKEVEFNIVWQQYLQASDSRSRLETMIASSVLADKKMFSS